MKYKIISGNDSRAMSLRSAIEKYIELNLPQMNVEDLVIIDISSIFNGRNTTERIVEPYVLDKQKIIILLGLETEISRIKKTSYLFKKVLACPNVGFVNLLQFEDLARVYQELKNPELKRSNGGTFKGKLLKGIFVDAYQTLFDENWKIDQTMKGYVEQLSRRHEKSVFVISDTEEHFVLDKLREEGMGWNVLSKYNLRGTILEIVIDKFPYHRFKEEYDIEARTFFVTSNILSEL